MKQYSQITDQFHVYQQFQKSLKRYFFNQLYEYFTDKKLFYNAQYGFRSEHSTEFATLDLVDRIMIEMDKMNTPVNFVFGPFKRF